MIDKNFCMSSYLAFRYIEKDDVDFKEGFHHNNIKSIEESKRIGCKTSEDIEKEIAKQFNDLKNKKLGILLSGGMDSASLATYMQGCDAYTFRFLNGELQKEELQRAETYAKVNNMKLHYVDINWDVVEKNIDILMERKCAPVHSIEPQIYEAALQAKKDGVEVMIVGESADLIFGGMDQLLSKDWDFDEFVNRYTFTDPKNVLKNPQDVNYLFERYRKDNDKIDFLQFMDDVFSIESSSSYLNAFNTAGLDYYDPYAILKMIEDLDLYRVRHGEPKYLIRGLFKLRYTSLEVPNKVPMPRPVEKYFENWKGPTRSEFIDNLDMSQFTGNQKWQIWCLERFLNNLDNKCNA